MGGIYRCTENRQQIIKKHMSTYISVITYAILAQDNSKKKKEWNSRQIRLIGDKTPKVVLKTLNIC